MTFIIPERLVTTCRSSPDGRAWLDQLPHLIRELQDRWSLSLEPPFEGEEVSCAWVARAASKDGTRTVLKVSMPHMEAAHEIDGLRFWHGEPTVQLLAADAASNAMLLEYCDPGTHLRALPEPEQDSVVAGLLHRLWRRPAVPHPFRPLSAMTAHWAAEAITGFPPQLDGGLLQTGLRLFEELSRPSPDDVLLATDLHAGNILRAQREPWLVIDPKPFVGDPVYDATQHLFNCEGRMRTSPVDTIRRFADLLEVDGERLRLWMFARSAAEPRDTWDEDSLRLARLLA